MPEPIRERPDTMETLRDRLLDAALPHVPFDGWSEITFRAAVTDSGADAALARACCPRAGVDLALAYHRRGNRRMRDALAATDLSALRFRDRIATAIRLRLDAVEDKELVRRGSALFALPHHAGEGAKAVWATADLIWRTLGDTATDINWYTKRMTLSAVYGATVLYWLGDDSPDHAATWEFLDRRIDGVMQIEKAKAKFRESPGLRALFAGPLRAAAKVTPPADLSTRLPGQVTRKI